MQQAAQAPAQNQSRRRTLRATRSAQQPKCNGPLKSSSPSSCHLVGVEDRLADAFRQHGIN